MEELEQIIRAEIEAGGPMRFERFMELSLYHPTLGYYRRTRTTGPTGRQGDFITSVSVGSLFGRLLARQFLEMWERLGRPEPFHIFEQGAGDGHLACDIVAWCREQAPAFHAALRYVFVEDAESERAKQSAVLERERVREKVEWRSSSEISTRAELAGVFFSNELVDAFPVRRITRLGHEWLESVVALDGDRHFVWQVEKIQDEALSRAIEESKVPEIAGYTTEINLRARSWRKTAGDALQRGYFLTIDYGFPREVYYAPFRTGGTLSAYRNHRRSDQILSDPGAQDITAHVDFTALAEAGAAGGWRMLGFMDQQHFLMGIVHDELSGEAPLSAGVAEHSRAWQTLVHPGHLGTRFQVLLEAKDAPENLACLRFARREP